MKIVGILLCLCSERFLIHSISYKRFYWFPDYYKKIKKLAEKNNYFTNNWAQLALIVIPILLLVSLAYLVLHHIIFGLVGFVLSIIIFFYCLGPENIFYPIAQSDHKNEVERIGDYFVQTNRQLFSLIFWFIIAGPIGALAYRLITLCCNLDLVHEQAKETTDLLEWLPTRVTTLLFLLVGNFQRSYSLFIKFLFVKPELNHEMLRECGLMAVRENEADELSMVKGEELVEHAIVVILVLIALFTLISWL